MRSIVNHVIVTTTKKFIVREITLWQIIPNDHPKKAPLNKQITHNDLYALCNERRKSHFLLPELISVRHGKRCFDCLWMNILMFHIAKFKHCKLPSTLNLNLKSILNSPALFGCLIICLPFFNELILRGRKKYAAGNWFRCLMGWDVIRVICWYNSTGLHYTYCTRCFVTEAEKIDFHLQMKMKLKFTIFALSGAMSLFDFQYVKRQMMKEKSISTHCRTGHTASYFWSYQFMSYYFVDIQ